MGIKGTDKLVEDVEHVFLQMKCRSIKVGRKKTEGVLTSTYLEFVNQQTDEVHKVHQF